MRTDVYLKIDVKRFIYDYVEKNIPVMQGGPSADCFPQKNLVI